MFFFHLNPFCWGQILDHFLFYNIHVIHVKQYTFPTIQKGLPKIIYCSTHTIFYFLFIDSKCIPVIVVAIDRRIVLTVYNTK